MKRKAIFVSVGLLILVLTFSSCKKSEEASRFDIRGTWGVVMTIEGQSVTGTFTFQGTLTYGNVITEGVITGSYNVNDRQVTITHDTYSDEYGDIHFTLTGVASGDNQMGGTLDIFYVDFNQTVTGTWRCNR